jgi:hypothetical protein
MITSAGASEAEARCRLSDLPESMCAHCRGHDGPAVIDPGSPRTAPVVLLDDDEFGPAFTSRFDGWCAVCGERTYEGQIIAKLTDDSGYACARHLP